MNDKQNQVAKAQTDAQQAPEEQPVDKYPTLTPLVEKLKQEKDTILKKSEAWRKRREELVREIQPLEDKLRQIDAEIEKIERPRLPGINNELGALARAMGGRSMNQGEAR